MEDNMNYEDEYLVQLEKEKEMRIRQQQEAEEQYLKGYQNYLNKYTHLPNPLMKALYDITVILQQTQRLVELAQPKNESQKN